MLYSPRTIKGEQVSYSVIIVDEPAEGVCRVTLNRPEKRNALNHALRGELLDALRQADADDSHKVSIVRGAGTSFSAGYDLGGATKAWRCRTTRPGATGSGPAT